MMNRKTLLIAALMTSFTATSAFADGDRGGDNPWVAVTPTTDDSPWYPTISADATPAVSAFELAYTEDRRTRNVMVGDHENGYEVQTTYGSLQCASCNVREGFETDFQVEDQKRFDQENRAYNYQAGLGVSTVGIAQTEGRNLAIAAQGPRSKDSKIDIKQLFNYGDESKAMVIDHSEGSIATIEQNSSENVVAKIEYSDGADNQSSIAQIKAIDSVANIKMNGDSNHVAMTQTGEKNIAVVEMEGSMNNVDIKQIGDENIALVESIRGREADASHVLIDQFGNNNQGYTRIGGINNLVMAKQLGNNDYFCSTQVSDNNQFYLTQR